MPILADEHDVLALLALLHHVVALLERPEGALIWFTFLPLFSRMTMPPSLMSAGWYPFLTVAHVAVGVPALPEAGLGTRGSGVRKRLRCGS